MVSINIASGQGLTQAIRDKIGAENIKNADLETWQKVISEVNNAQKNAENQSIFRSGNKYTTDVNKLGDTSTYKSNFVVDQGTVHIDDSVWNKIKELLTSPKKPAAQQPAQGEGEVKPPVIQPPINEVSQQSEPDVSNDSPSITIHVTPAKTLSRQVDGENVRIAVINKDGQKVRYTVNDDGTLGDTLAATKTFGKNKYISGDFPPETRILERDVNGQKSRIGIYEDENGNKIRKLVVTDEETGKTTLGENLVTVSTAGKNKYVTQSKFESDVKLMLGLGENEEIPSDLKPEYVSIGGESSIVIKKDGKVMDSKQLREYMSEYNHSLQAQPKVSPLVTDHPPVEYESSVQDGGLPNVSTWNDKNLPEEQRDANKLVFKFVRQCQIFNDNGFYNIRGHKNLRLSFALTKAEQSMRGLIADRPKYMTLSNKPAETLTEDERKFLQAYNDKLGLMELTIDSKGQFANVEGTKFVRNE